MKLFSLSKLPLKQQIVIPLIVAILVGLGISALISYQVSKGQEAISEISAQALAARTQSNSISAEISVARVEIDHLLSMTSYVSIEDIKSTFIQYDTKISNLLEGFSSNHLSNKLSSEVVNLAQTYNIWSESVQISLGLVKSNSIPTMERLHREYEMVSKITDHIYKMVTVAAQSKTQIAQNSLKNTIRYELVALVIGGLFAIIGSWFISNSITRPIHNITSMMNELAQGKTEITLPAQKFAVEINDMITAMEVFQGNGQEMSKMRQIEQGQNQDRAEMQSEVTRVVASAVNGDFSTRITKTYADNELNLTVTSLNELISSVDSGLNQTGHVLSALANSDLTQRVNGQFKGAFAKLQEDTNRVADKFSEIINNLRETSSLVKSAVGEIQNSSTVLAGRTENQAVSIEKTATSVEEITVRVKTSAQRAEEASNVVSKTRENAESSGQIVNNAVEAMGRIENSASKISNIIGVIDEIAFQTNLLALNAGVEAARAGDAGRGFAVVAIEVRELAQRSATAAREIKTLIKASESEVKTGVQLVNETGSSLQSVVDEVQEINEHVVAIVGAAREQAIGLDEINSSINTIDSTTQKNAVMAEEFTASSHVLAKNVVKIDDMLNQFTVHKSGVNSKIPGAQNEYLETRLVS